MRTAGDLDLSWDLLVVSEQLANTYLPKHIDLVESQPILNIIIYKYMICLNAFDLILQQRAFRI